MRHNLAAMRSRSAKESAFILRVIFAWRVSYRDLADTESVADLLVQAAGDDERHDLPVPRTGMRVIDGRLRLRAVARVWRLKDSCSRNLSFVVRAGVRPLCLGTSQSIAVGPVTLPAVLRATGQRQLPLAANWNSRPISDIRQTYTMARKRTSLGKLSAAHNVGIGRSRPLAACRGRQSRLHSHRLLIVRWGLGRDCVDLHRRGAASQLLQAKVLAREALEIRQALQRIARDEELALEVSRRLFDA